MFSLFWVSVWISNKNKYPFPTFHWIGMYFFLYFKKLFYALPKIVERKIYMVFFYFRTLKLNSLTFLKSQPKLPVRDVTHIPGLIPIWNSYFDISEWHILLQCTWTPALMLHLTNSCANRKVLKQLNQKARYIKQNPSAIVIQIFS